MGIPHRCIILIIFANLFFCRVYIAHACQHVALFACLLPINSSIKVESEIVDIWTDYGRFPFASAVGTYKFLGRHPRLWKLSYDMARFPLTRCEI